MHAHAYITCTRIRTFVYVHSYTYIPLRTFLAPQQSRTEAPDLLASQEALYFILYTLYFMASQEALALRPARKFGSSESGSDIDDPYYYHCYYHYHHYYHYTITITITITITSSQARPPEARAGSLPGRGSDRSIKPSSNSYSRAYSTAIEPI